MRQEIKKNFSVKSDAIRNEAPSYTYNFCLFLVLMLLLTFSRKNLYLLNYLFFCFLFYNARKFISPSVEVSIPLPKIPPRKIPFT